VGEAALRIGGSGRRGTVVICGLLDDAAPGDALAQSVLEQLLGDLLRAAGIERFSRQFPLPGRGEMAGYVDTFLHDADVIVEADGRRWHSRQAAMRRDYERDFAAQQVGVMTVRLLHEHLTADLEGCADGLRRIVEQRRPMVAARRAAQAS
jgi:very-short-patch-repair endonuclease